MNNIYFSDTGNTIQLDKEVGSGAEGVVYLIRGNSAYVAKIYSSQQPVELHSKLLVMVRNPPHDPTVNGPTKHRSIGWPSEILYWDRQKKQFAGFIMPKIDLQSFKKILLYTSPEDRKKEFEGRFTWRYLHATALNLSSCLAAIHERGYCVGDFNESNVLVSPATPLTIIDCDSFQVTDPATGEKWRCTVGKPEYTAPEIIKYKYKDVDRTKETDCFALAVMIFQLLMEGFHPYASTGKAVDDANNTAEKIKKGIFPHTSSRRDIAPAHGVPPFSILHPEIQALFQRCFDTGHKSPKVRPSAKEWMTTLKKTGPDFKECGVNENHHFLSHLSVCPWCERAKKFGNDVDSFPNPIGQQVLLQNPNQNQASMTERKSWLLIQINAVLADGYVSFEEEAHLIAQGLKLNITKQESKNLINQEIKSRGLSGATGAPVLSANKSSIEFKQVKQGSTPIETIEVSNVGDGIMTGTISSSASWLKVPSTFAPCRKNQSQKIQLQIITKNLPYGFSGTTTVSIKTANKNYNITVKLTTVGLSHLIAYFRTYLVPLTATLGGFLFSFGNGAQLSDLGFLATIFFFPIYARKIANASILATAFVTIVAFLGGALVFSLVGWFGKFFPHFIAYLIGVYFTGFCIFLSSDFIVKQFRSVCIQLSRLSPVYPSIASVGVVILTLLIHTNGVDTPIHKTKKEYNVQATLHITKSVMASAINSNDEPTEISKSFRPGRKNLYYYVSYTGAQKNKTWLNAVLYNNGKPITIKSYINLEDSSGNARWGLDHNYTIGNYEVRLFNNGREIDRQEFSIAEPVKP